MGAERFDRWDAFPVRLDYQSRLPAGVWTAAHPRRRGDQPVTTAVRATATTLVIGCLAVAVPCVVFAGVGWWFNDISTVDAAWVAVGAAAGAAVAAVPAVACHRRIVQRRPGRRGATWN